MADQNYYDRSDAGLNRPETPEEQTLSTLLNELRNISARYKNDSVMVVAVENLGSAIIRLLDAPTGRIDQSIVDNTVRHYVAAAGGDSNEL